MKTLAITPRIDEFKSYKETRNSLDIQLINFVFQCGYKSIILPHNTKNTKSLLKDLKIAGIILSGGNNLFDYKGKYKFRDDNERVLLKHAIANNIPLLGICRGMQLILDFFGIKLTAIKNHKKINHKILFNNKALIVNSFHKYGARFTENDNLEILAISEDHNIEAIKSKKHPIYGIMWHPERNASFKMHDKKLINQIFG